MPHINFRRVFFLAGTSSLILVYLMLWVRVINDPAERTGSDYIALYSAGMVAKAEGLSHVFNVKLLQSVQEKVVGFPLAEGQVLLYNHVPFLVPFITLVAGENYQVSFLIWSMLMLLVFLLSLTLLALLFHIQGWRNSTTIVSWFGLLVFFPLFVSLMNGQDTALTTLGLCLWIFGLLSKRMWLAGLGLALVTVRPQIALLLALPFLFRQRQVFLWFCLGTVVLSFFSWLTVGWEGLQNFVNLVLLSARGSFYGLQESAMVNLVGLFLRLFPMWDTQGIHWIGWVAYFVVLVTLCIIWGKNRILDERHFSLAVCLALFFSPHLHYHDLALLVVPISCVMIYFFRKKVIDEQALALFPLGISLFLILGSLVPGVKNDLPSLVILFLAISPWVWVMLGSKNFRKEMENE